MMESPIATSADLEQAISYAVAIGDKELCVSVKLLRRMLAVDVESRRALTAKIKRAEATLDSLRADMAAARAIHDALVATLSQLRAIE